MRALLRLLYLIACSIAFLPAVAQLNADFSADVTQGCGSISGVKFTDLSTGNVVNWNWDFGNSNTSTLKNPVASYTSPGTYTVTLTVDDGTNSNTIVKTAFIRVFENPVAGFSFTPSTGCSPLSVAFTNTSTDGDTTISEYKWDFADGSLGSLKDPVHPYQSSGSFTPTLQVTDHNGCTDFVSGTAISVTQSPEAAFSTVDNTITCEDTLTVDFVNNSQGSNTVYKWDFGDNNTSTQKSPTHFYQGLGTYDVTLIVTDTVSNCADTIVQEKLIKLEETTAQFTLNKKEFCFGETVEITNQSTGSPFYQWDFGDGTTSSLESPNKIYKDTGTFVIKLSAFAGPCITDTTDTIYVEGVEARFASSPDTICQKADTSVFINQSVNAAQLVWNIHVGNGIVKTFLVPGDSSKLVFPYDNLEPKELKTGFYMDELVAVSPLGCRDTLSLDSNRYIDILETRIFYNDEDKLQFEDSLGRGIIGGCFPISFDFYDTVKGPQPIISWDWDLGNGTTSSLSKPPTVTYDNDTQLYVVSLTVENALGCKASTGLFVQGGAPQMPDFILDPMPDTICPVGPVFVIDKSTDTNKIQTYTYEFISADTNLKFQTDTPGVLANQFTDTGYYSLEHSTFSNGCKATIRRDSLFYVEGPIANFTFEVSGQCADRKKVLFEPKMLGYTKFIWDFGDMSPLDSINDTLVHTFPIETRYEVTLMVINDSNDCDTAIVEKVIDISPTSPPTMDFDSTKLCASSDTFVIKLINLVQYNEIEWLYNGSVISTEDSIKLVFDSVGLQTIKVRGIDVIGCPDSTTRKVRVSDIKAGFDTSLISICLPFQATFMDTSVSDTTINKWTWIFDGIDTLKQKVVNFSYNTPGTRDVFLRVENVLGCRDSIEIRDFINIENYQVGFLTGTSQICAGDSVEFRNTPMTSGVQYRWDFGDGTVLDTNAEFIDHQYKQPGTYTVSLSLIASNGCVITETKADLVEVDAIPIAGFTADGFQSDCIPFEVNFTDTSQGNIDTWEWSFSDGVVSVLQNPSRNFTSIDEFDVTLKVTSPNGCSNEITKPAYIKTTGPTGQFSIDKDTACINEPITFRLLSIEDATSFLWDFGDGFSSSDTIAVHSYDSTGIIMPSLILSDSLSKCNVPLIDEIFIFDVKAAFSISEDSGCVPFTVNFTNQSQGNNNTYLWRFGQGSTSTSTSPTFTFDQAGSYRVRLEVNSDVGCRDTVFKDIVALPNPEAFVTSDTGICSGDTVPLQAGGGISYQWSPGSSLSDSNLASVLAFPDVTTNYTVEVFNEFNCSDTAGIEVAVQNPPSFIALTDTSLIIGEELDLDVSAGNGFNYQWTPSNGLSCTDCPNPTAQPLETQQYVVRISDDFGCFTVLDTIRIEVKEVFSLDVPTAFSPNKDGVNDVIFVNGWGLKELIAFKIYNRFGELVFESQDFDHGWDGKYRGEDQNIETYVYTVEALTFGDKVLTKKGNITLLR